MKNKLFYRFIFILMWFLLNGTEAWCKNRTIRQVAEVKVECPAGTAPVLPWQVWVTYSDGTHEWRQVRWNNSDLKVEESQADAQQHPVGSTYTVQGVLLGEKDYSLQATVRVTAQGLSVPAHPVAETIPLTAVHLTGNTLLSHNRDLDIQNLLSLDITQYLYNYRDTYGLSKEGYTEAEGWDSPTTKLKGHGTGHFLSALAFAYAGTQDAALKAELKSRIRRMVEEMRACQERTFVWDDSLGRYREARDLAPEPELQGLKGTWEDFDVYKKDWTHYGYGYLNAIPAQHCALVETYTPYHNEKGVWAPYYTVHKQLAGLIDIANQVDDAELAAKALLIAKDMGLWVWNRLHYRTYVKTDGTEEERRARPGNRYEMWNMYIAGEVGGMAEALSRLSEMVSDREESRKLLEAASYFDAPAFFHPVEKNIDAVRNRHANQHIPMIIGALRAYRNNGKDFYYHLASNFWEMMQGRYVYAMGGVGNAERWREPYTQMASMNGNTEKDEQGNDVPDPCINETCCAYNLAKLTKDLNCFHPDDARYMDYYERVLYNQIVGSLNSEEYGVTYQYAVGLNARKPFGNNTPQESCCGGTGAENHVKYPEAAYFTNAQTLWVGLYLPTEARWEAQGVTIHQDCEWPAEYSKISFSEAQGKKFSVKLRVPSWATKGFDVRLNGKSVAKKYLPCSYVEIPVREWKDGDVVEISMPFSLHLNYGADQMEGEWLGALMYGPLVMTSPDIHSWEEAKLKKDLSEVKVLKGEKNFSLMVGSKKFVPDYLGTGESTHYLRVE